MSESLSIKQPAVAAAKKTARSFEATLPSSSYNEDSVRSLVESEGVKDWVAVLEFGEKTGFAHWHCYIEYPRSTRISTVKRRFREVERIEPVANKKAFLSYIAKTVQKDGAKVIGSEKLVNVLWEQGDSNPTRKRSLYSKIEEYAQRGYTEEEILSILPAASHSPRLVTSAVKAYEVSTYGNGKQPAKVHYIETPQVDTVISSIEEYYVTKEAQTPLYLPEFHDRGNWVYHLTGDRNAWDYYNGEGVVIAGDNVHSLPLTQLAEWVSQRPVLLYARGRSHWKAYHRLFIVTSYPFTSFYTKSLLNDSYAAASFARALSSVEYIDLSTGVIEANYSFRKIVAELESKGYKTHYEPEFSCLEFI